MLRAVGISSSLLCWLESYLTGLTQKVKIDGLCSRAFSVTSGVPHGSHLDPLLFCLFINDLCDEFVDCFYLLYADDLKLSRKICTTEDCDVLQANLDRLQAWCVANKMALSVHKCSVIKSNI